MPSVCDSPAVRWACQIMGQCVISSAPPGLQQCQRRGSSETHSARAPELRERGRAPWGGIGLGCPEQAPSLTSLKGRAFTSAGPRRASAGSRRARPLSPHCRPACKENARDAHCARYLVKPPRRKSATGQPRMRADSWSADYGFTGRQSPSARPRSSRARYLSLDERCLLSRARVILFREVTNQYLKLRIFHRR